MAPTHAAFAFVLVVALLDSGCSTGRHTAWRARSSTALASERADACLADVPACTARCEGGDAATCNLLGVQLEIGLIGGPRPHAASQAYIRGCNEDYPPSCANLGWLVLRGTGVPANPPLALVLFQRAYDGYSHACMMGHGPSCVAAVDALDMADAEPGEEIALLDRGCELGEERACRERAAPR